MAFFRTSCDHPGRTSPLRAVIASRAQLGAAISAPPSPRSLIMAVALACIVLASTAAAKIIYVDDDATGANNGTSWPNAYTFLQDALADANSADKPLEIHVAQGTHKPDQGENQTLGDREASFHLISGVTIKGGYAGLGAPDPNARDIAQYETILSGDLAGNDIAVADPCDLLDEPTRAENCYRVVTAVELLDATLDGLTVTAGHAYEKPWDWQNPDPNGLGGGMFIDSASPAVVDCTFRRNSASGYGGGIWICDPNHTSSPKLTRCRFVENACGEYGGGMFNDGASPVLVGCAFSRNSAGSYAGGLGDRDGGLALSACTFSDNRAGRRGGGIGTGAGNPVIVDSLFTGNHAREGGGLFNCVMGRLTLRRCRFLDNTADQGGALFNAQDCKTVISDCRFAGNTATEKGGAVLTMGLARLSMTRCRVVENTSPEGAGIHNACARLRICNSVLAGNSADVGGGVYCSDATDGVLVNCTFGANSASKGSGIACKSRELPVPNLAPPGNLKLVGCILWNGPDELWNANGATVDVTFSDIQGGLTGLHDPHEAVTWGPGNVDVDPLFADVSAGDCHLMSQAGRWDPTTESWVTDDVTSPCIDAGEPTTPVGHEPFPNGGVVNMGAYGGMAEASRSYLGKPPCETIIAGDVNGDCRVDLTDFAILASHWLERVSFNRLIEDGIEYHISTNKALYKLGESVEVVYRISNRRDVHWRAESPAPMMDVVIERREGENFTVSWKLSWGLYDPWPGPAVLQLPPNESVEVDGTWSDTDAQGIYRVSGLCRPTGTRVSVEILVTP